MSKKIWYCLKTKIKYDEDPQLETAFPWEYFDKDGEGMFFCFPDNTIGMKDTEIAGKSLFTLRDIKKGELIWHYDIDEKATASLTNIQFWSLPRKQRIDFYTYVWQFDEDFYTGPKITEFELESVKQRDATNFLNHSCDPNCAFDGPLMIRAHKDILKGEELSYDYMTSETNPFYEPFDCACESANCRKRLTTVDYRIPFYQDLYKGHLFPLVQKMIDLEGRMKAGEGPYKELNHKLVLKETGDEIMGRGLFCTQKILEGEPVWIDQTPWGRPEKEMTLEELNLLPEEKRKFCTRYLREIDQNLFSVPLDSETIESNYFYFFNHGCESNVKVYSPIIWIASRDIEPGEQLLIDYSTLFHQIHRIPSKCVCGSKSCRGELKLEDWKDKELQKKYGRFWMPHILVHIAKMNN